MLLIRCPIPAQRHLPHQWWVHMRRALPAFVAPYSLILWLPTQLSSMIRSQDSRSHTPGIYDFESPRSTMRRLPLISRRTSVADPTDASSTQCRTALVAFTYNKSPVIASLARRQSVRGTLPPWKGLRPMPSLAARVSKHTHGLSLEQI
jgi:hypothetical protein